MKTYNKHIISNARLLRKNQTKYERKLWYEFLRNYPVRFRRQATIGNYIVDFYCAKAKLAIEVDGGGHYTQEAEVYDNERTEYLELMHVKTVRFTNLEIAENFRGVCEAIDQIVGGYKA